MGMDAACPACGTRDVRLAHSHGLGERFLELFGVYPLRCKHCQTRFSGKLWKISQVRYAHCPKCYRTELSTWSEQYYNPSSSVKLKLALGATPYRCEFCRCNFASFRACRERFSWRRYRRHTDGTPVAQPGQAASAAASSGENGSASAQA